MPSSGTVTLDLAHQAYLSVRAQLPVSERPYWDHLAKGQPLGIVVRLARLWRVNIT